jgi:hypothetical protein
MYSHDEKLLQKFLNGRQGKRLEEGFAYTSDSNKKWLSVRELQTLVENV